MTDPTGRTEPSEQTRSTAPSGRGKPADPRALPHVFELFRHKDVTGYSGVGVVAYGVEWPDGSVALRWRGPVPSTVVFEGGIIAIEQVHGHDGATEIKWPEPGNPRQPHPPHPPPWPPPDPGGLPPEFPRT